jgi:hypothetical protein
MVAYAVTLRIVFLRLSTITACLLLGGAAPAGAQYSQTIFLELVRDPGHADVARTARSLALAGIQSGSGTAEEAVVSPASLLLSTGSDVVASGGFFRYARNEFVATPRQLPPWDPDRQLTEASRTPAAFVGAATRGSQWAVAGFYDATSRYEHGFATAKSTLVSLALFPSLLILEGSGLASISESVTRIGGSVAVGRAASRTGIGATISLVRFNYIAAATDTIEERSRSSGNPVIRYFCCIVDQDRVEFRNWAPAIALSGVFAPFAHTTVAARWRHEPTFSAVRHLTVNRGTPDASERHSEPVRFRLPGAYGVTLTVASRSTSVHGAVTREVYAGTFSPLMWPTFDPNYGCTGVTGTCSGSGWNFPYHDTKNVTSVRTAVEQTVAAGPGRFALRGGIAFLPGYTLARSATHISTRRTLDFPAPPIVTPFEPPREGALSISGGVAYMGRLAEVAMGIGTANHQTRLLVDLRFHSR